MALRTRIFATILKRVSTPVEDAGDFATFRAERRALQAKAVGKLVFGKIDRDSTVEEIVLGTGQRALVHRPRGVTGPLPCVVNFHGGGWVQGNPEQSAWLSSRIAVRNRVVVIAPAYRLAPEDVFPAGVDDSWGALNWIALHGDELGVT